MLYTLLIYESPDDFAGRSDAETTKYVSAWRDYYASLLASGSYQGGNPLTLPDTGTTVRMRDGRRQIQDGPYANTKEQLGGFILLELPSLDAALELASKCPAAISGAVEVRPVAGDVKTRIENEGESR